MKEPLVDISVLIIFFTRPDTLQQVFDRVKEARPARLFLYQDGPREGRSDDKENILKCRDIVSDIDWDCEVHTLYQEKNYGPDESGYIADTWAFSQTDKCIVLEDDVIPSLSYFTFCKEMLDRYEHDERVMLISGWNLEEETKGVETDYFFSYTRFTMAWASWARVARGWDPDCSALLDDEKYAQMDEHMRQNHLLKRWLRKAKEGRLSPDYRIRFELVIGINQLLHRGLTIVPRVNMASNIGVGGDSSHYQVQLKQMARGDRRIFEMKAHELDVDHLVHPDEVKDYPQYRKNAFRIRAWEHPFVHSWRVLESTFYQLCDGGNRKKVLGAACRKAWNLITGNYT